MAENSFINFNGEVLPASQPVLKADNRAFRYGDAVFETIRLMHGDLLFFDRHLARLKQSMQLLGMSWRDDFSFHNLYLLMRHLDQVNQLNGNGRIRMEVFRNAGGNYAPESGDVSFLIEATPLEAKEYVLNDRPLRIDVYNEIAKPRSKISNLKSSNALIHVMAGLYRKQTDIDECVLLNDLGKICEASSSNIFLVSREDIYTPSLDEGCVEGVMRALVIEKLRDKGRNVHEVQLSISHMHKADEVFLTNVITGIRWVGAFRQKRFFNATSRGLIAGLSETQSKVI